MTAAPLRSRPSVIVDRIVDRLNALTLDDLIELGAWTSLDTLSTSTIFEAVDADPNSVVLRPDESFEALASTYVTLTYGSGKEVETMSDEYLATIVGRADTDSVEIDRITVDTSSFYE